MSSQTSYDMVGKTSGVCAISEKKLEPGEEYVATLIEVGETFERQDICNEVWDSGHRPEGLFSFWKATMPTPNEKKKLFVDDQVLMDIVKKLADADQHQRLAFRYVVSLLLMRKKMLRYEKTDRREEEFDDGTKVLNEYWIMTPKLDVSKGRFGKWDEKTKLEILDPRLDEQQILEVTEQLGEILQAEL